MNNDFMIALTDLHANLVRLGAAAAVMDGFDGFRARGFYNDLVGDFNFYVRKTKIINPLPEMVQDLEEEKAQGPQTPSEAFRLAN